MNFDVLHSKVGTAGKDGEIDAEAGVTSDEHLGQTSA